MWVPDYLILMNEHLPFFIVPPKNSRQPLRCWNGLVSGNSVAAITTSLNIRFSAINSDESSGRNFAAYQNVAKALNGTAAAANAPSATPTAGSGANSVKMGGISISLVFAAVVGFLL